MSSQPQPGGCFACSSKPGSIFCDLAPGHLAELDRLRQASTFPAGALVYAEGEQPRAAYCVCAGQVKLTRSSPEGRVVVLGVAQAGDVLGVRPLLLGQMHDHSAQTSEETRLCFVPRDEFMAFLARNAEVSLRLAQKLGRELAEAYRRVCSVALKPATERVAELLLALCQTHGHPTPDGISLRTNMCQDELAELMGMSRRTFTRALEKLKREGLIECRRRFIIVRDLMALGHCLTTTG